MNIKNPNINNNDEFHTDSNGLLMVKRKKLEGAKVPQNYYPVTSAIYIKDKDSNYRMTVMVDRAEGGTSIRNGEIELMIQRIL